MNQISRMVLLVSGGGLISGFCVFLYLCLRKIRAQRRAAAVLSTLVATGSVTLLILWLYLPSRFDVWPIFVVQLIMAVVYVQMSSREGRDEPADDFPEQGDWVL